MQSRFASYETPSFTIEGKEKVNGTDQFLPGSFSPLYPKECEEETASKCRTTSSLSDSPRLLDSPPPENLRASSSSLVTDESACYLSASDTGDSSTKGKAEEIRENGSSGQEDLIAVLTYSPCPYEDFRRSMQELVEARLEHNGEVDWEFMEDLLFRYLDLNNEKFCRYIMRAFLDLVVVLRENRWKIPASRRPWDGGGGGGLPKREM